MDAREIIARRAAQELKDGEIVNLGIGLPTQVSNYLPEGMNLMFHAENGAFGFGAKPKLEESDCDLANAGGEPITLLPGACIVNLATSLGAMRNGYLNTTILGALEVDQYGNIANWGVNKNNHWWPGMGGAMDLTYGTKKVVATLMHTDKHGNSKVLKKCTLPVTGKKCVKVIITEKAVFDVGDSCLILRETAPGVTIEEIKSITEADFIVSNNFHEMKL